MRKTERLDFVGAFEQGWIQYKANISRIIGWGILISIPPLFIHINITWGIILSLVFEGFFMILLANSVESASRGLKNEVLTYPRILLNYFKNGFLISIFLFPLITIGIIALIIPGILVFSVFMFSFFIVAAKQNFAIDALMDSLREGNGYRFPLFLFSLIFGSAIAFTVLVTHIFMPLGFIISSVIVPYFFTVIYEFYDQLERK